MLPKVLMELVLLAVFIVFFVVISLWGALNGRFYRSPIRFVFLAIAVGIFGALCSFAIGSFGGTSELERAFPYHELAKDIITILVSSLSGSLIVSAILIKVERKHAEEIDTDKRKVELAKSFQEIAKANDNHLKEIGKDIGNPEFWQRYHTIRRQELNSLFKLLDAQEKLEEKQI